jgi:hypothetical protein
MPDASSTARWAGTHVTIADGQWALWRQAVLRAPGFPAARLSALAAPGLAAMIDAMPAGVEVTADYRARYATEMAGIGAEVQRLAAVPDFQRALAWQNRNVLDIAIPSLLRHDARLGRRTSAHRRREELIVRYWQRYTLKNETIGFFGPVGWAQIDPAAATAVRPGSGLIASAEVFFETWTMDQVAETIGKLPGMRRFLAPRRLPFVGLDPAATAAVLPGPATVRLSPAEYAVLSRCDGITPAAGIAVALAARDSTEDSVFAILDRLCRLRLASWRLELPVSPWPERDLRRAIAGIGDQALATAAAARLDRLERARTEVTAVMRHPDHRLVAAALRSLDEEFVQLTGAAATRNRGQAYGSRTPAYHDCRRDAEVRMGAEVITALRPIELLLTSARWLTYEVGTRFRDLLHEQFTAVRQRAREPVTLADFWLSTLATVHRQAARIVADVTAEFKQRWAVILKIPPGRRGVAYRREDLAAAVDLAFAAPGAGWSAARYSSPDVLIAAAGVDAIEAGQFELILGEFHLAINSCRHNGFFTQHPRPGLLWEVVDRDYPEPRLLPVLPKENSGRLTVGTHPALIRPEDHLVALGQLTADPARPNLWASADLKVIEADGLPVAELPTGERFDLVDVYSEMLMDLIINEFEILPPGPHTPRVTIDRLVVSRESWTVTAGDLPFAAVVDEPLRFARARRWRLGLGLPRHVFVKVPGELKPLYADLDSPISVNQLARAARRCAVAAAQATAETTAQAVIRFTEMRPSLDELWLADADGARYTSELRIVAVDTEPAWTR